MSVCMCLCVFIYLFMDGWMHGSNDVCSYMGVFLCLNGDVSNVSNHVRLPACLYDGGSIDESMNAWKSLFELNRWVVPPQVESSLGQPTSPSRGWTQPERTDMDGNGRGNECVSWEDTHTTLNSSSERRGGPSSGEGPA